MKDFWRFSVRWWHHDDTVEERVKREERDRRARTEHIPLTTVDMSCRCCGNGFFLLLLRRDPSFVERGRKRGTRASVGEDWDKNLHLNSIKAHHKASYCLQHRPRSSPPKPTAHHPLETLWASSLSSPEIFSNLRPPQPLFASCWIIPLFSRQERLKLDMEPHFFNGNFGSFLMDTTIRGPQIDTGTYPFK